VSAQHTPGRGCPECAWGKVAGCWRCGSRVAHDAVPAVGPTRRACFIRRKLGEFRLQAQFNRAHYSDAEAFCWDAAAADCLQALGGMAGDWQRANDERASITLTAQQLIDSHRTGDEALSAAVEATRAAP